MGYQGSYWKNGRIYRPEAGFIRMGPFGALTGLLIGILVVVGMANSIRIIAPEAPVEIEMRDCMPSHDVADGDAHHRGA